MHLDPTILSNFAQRCPLLYRRLCGKRYLLSTKFQGIYSNQDAGIQQRIICLLGGALMIVKIKLKASCRKTFLPAC